MKFSLIALLCAFTMPLMASVKTYTNTEGCELMVEDTVQKVIYTLKHQDKEEVVTFSGDYMSVDFAYCPNQTGDIFFTEGSAGYGLMVFCDQNKEAKFRGIVDLEVRNDGVVNSFSVARQEKDQAGKWVDTKNLSCSGFEIK